MRLITREYGIVRICNFVHVLYDVRILWTFSHINLGISESYGRTNGVRMLAALFLYPGRLPLASITFLITCY